MAMVKCAECGHAISDKASACPHCGAPQQGAAKSAAVSMGPIRRGLQWVWYGIMSVMVFACVYQWNKPREPREFGEAEARMLCSDAIRAAAKDRDKAEIPFVPATTAGDEISMSWNDGVGMLRLRNGLGLDVPASASCVVSKAQKRVTILSINGQTII